MIKCIALRAEKSFLNYIWERLLLLCVYSFNFRPLFSFLILFPQRCRAIRSKVGESMYAPPWWCPIFNGTIPLFEKGYGRLWTWVHLPRLVHKLKLEQIGWADARSTLLWSSSSTSVCKRECRVGSYRNKAGSNASKSSARSYTTWKLCCFVSVMMCDVWLMKCFRSSEVLRLTSIALERLKTQMYCVELAWNGNDGTCWSQRHASLYQCEELWRE